MRELAHCPVSPPGIAENGSTVPSTALWDRGGLGAYNVSVARPPSASALPRGGEVRGEVQGRLGPPAAQVHCSRSSSSSEMAEGVRMPRSVKSIEIRWGGVASHEMSYERSGASCSPAAGGVAALSELSRVAGGGEAGGGATGGASSHGSPHSAALPQPASGWSSCVRQKRKCGAAT